MLQIISINGVAEAEFDVKSMKIKNIINLLLEVPYEPSDSQTSEN